MLKLEDKKFFTRLTLRENDYEMSTEDLERAIKARFGLDNIKFVWDSFHRTKLKLTNEKIHFS